LSQPNALSKVASILFVVFSGPEFPSLSQRSSLFQGPTAFGSWQFQTTGRVSREVLFFYPFSLPFFSLLVHVEHIFETLLAFSFRFLLNDSKVRRFIAFPLPFAIPIRICSNSPRMDLSLVFFSATLSWLTFVTHFLLVVSSWIAALFWIKAAYRLSALTIREVIHLFCRCSVFKSSCSACTFVFTKSAGIPSGFSELSLFDPDPR